MPVLNTTTIDRQRRRRFLLQVSSLTLFTLLVFMVIDFNKGAFLEVCTDIFMCLVIILGTLSLFKFGHDRIHYGIAINLINLALIYDISMGGGDGGGLFWLLVIPMVVFFFLEKAEAILSAILFYLCSFILLLYPSLLDTHSYELSLAIRYLIALFFSNIIAYALESSRDTYSRLLIDANRELKQHREKLEESEKLFRNFNEQSFVGFYIIQDNLFSYVNTKFAAIFGYSVEECLNGMHLGDLVHPDDLSRVMEQVRRRASGEVDVVQYTARGIKKNGEVNHVSIFGSSLVYKGRHAAIGTILDITDDKQKEHEREQLIIELKEALEKVQTLSGLLPMCANCKKVRDDKGYWNQLETYIRTHTDADITHGLCPECAEEIYGGQGWYEKAKQRGRF